MTTQEQHESPPFGTDCESRISAFQNDLAMAHDSLRDVIQKHITTGEPAVVAAEVYYQLRRAIAQEFRIHPSSVILVGSCRTGFSLKPEKRYQPVSMDSDVDVAVISAALFDDYWDRVFDLTRTDHGWARSAGRKFSSDLFHGWITPRELPNRNRFEKGRKWAEFFDALTAQRTCGIRAISARLYRSWDRLEAYQEIMVSMCRNDLRKDVK